MKLRDIIDERVIKIGLEAKEKEGVLEELISLLENKFPVKNREELKKKLLEREAVKSTGIGNGIAIPHAYSEDIEEVAACIGISKEGIDFTCLDGKPAHIFVMIVANPKANLKYLSLLAHTARILSREEIKEKLLNASKQKEIVDIIREFES